MALKAKITKEAFDALDEVLRAQYTSTDNGYLLDVDSVEGWALEDVNGLKTALSKEKSNVKAAQDKLRMFGDLDPVEAKDAVKKVGDMANWTPNEKIEQQIAAREEQLLKKHNEELTAATSDRDDLQSQLEKQLVKGAAMTALAEHKGNPLFLLSHIEASTKIERDGSGQFVARVVDQEGNTRLTTKSGSTAPMEIGELVESLKGDNRFAGAFEGVGAQGIGGTGGQQGAGSSGGHIISSQDARDTSKYRAAKAAATKAGVELQIAE